MKILYISDLHLPVGPPEPLRPELRRNFQMFLSLGERFADYLERKLRLEAHRVKQVAESWLQLHSSSYDIIVNGGDNALPLHRHQDRIRACETVWRSQLSRFGENRLICLTGNHELGHGYDPELFAYPDLMKLRTELFSSEVNRYGYGWISAGGVTIALLDSELVFLHSRFSGDTFVRRHAERMRDQLRQAFLREGPLVVLTHNTTRACRFVHRGGLWNDLIHRGRHVVCIGGHYHIPRMIYRDGAEIWWTGGASYPEPWLRWLTGVPFTGFQHGGPGGVEIDTGPRNIRVRHVSYGVPMRRWSVAI